MRRTPLLIVALLLSAALAVAATACGDDNGDDDDIETTPPATEAAEPTEVEDETPEAIETPEAEGPTDGEATVIVSEHPELGPILTDAEGNTLYTFAEDGPNMSTCVSEPCPTTWPPFTIDGDPTAGEGVSGTLGTFARDGATMQVTYDEQPLYYFANDQAPGDANGQGIGGRWFVVEVGG